VKLLRVIGVLGGAAGLVLAAVPTLVSDPGLATDTYEAIERRVWWGAVAGFGALLATLRSLRPWSVTLVSSLFWIVAGLLTARVIGLVLDGTDSTRQWMWTAVELAICVVAGLYLRRTRARIDAIARGAGSRG
jgi:hypothetical protein